MTSLTETRADKDRFYREHPQSPLTPNQQSSFEGLRYYDENPDYIFNVEPDIFDDQNPVEMETSTGQQVTYVRWARVQLPVEGHDVELTIYKDPGSDDLFLPFQDSNRGGETYGAGRYLEAERREDGSLLLDFNYAYNPYCAYNENWSCPVPPAENRLDVAIKAGEMTFK